MRPQPVLDSALLVFPPEVVADDTPAVQAVLKADTRRLKLLDEEKRLQARLEKGDDSVAERLEKVSYRGSCLISHQLISSMSVLTPPPKLADFEEKNSDVKSINH